MDCTTTGASEPTRTPPTTAVTVFLRWIVAIWELPVYHVEVAFFSFNSFSQGKRKTTWDMKLRKGNGDLLRPSWFIEQPGRIERMQSNAKATAACPPALESSS